jgi:5-methyltetrahydrofolate--homocysteine methyltransferase
MAGRFLEHLTRRILVFDGAMGTSIHQRPLDLHTDYCGCENCTDILSRTRPDVIGEIHESFLRAGADCIETNSFGANRLVLAEFGLAERTREIARCAAEVARAAADRYSTNDKPRFVVGSIGPGTKLITLGQVEWETMLASYREQALGLLEGGVDAFIIETCQDLLQVKCAINAVLGVLGEAGRSPLDVPILVSVTIESSGTMLLGTEISAVAHALAGFPIASLGLNCATGPVEMREHVRWLAKHWRAMGGLPGTLMANGRAVSVMPNAGLPVLVDGRTEYPLKPGPFVETMGEFIERDGVSIVGGCCGTTPEHISLLARAVAERSGTGGLPAERGACIQVVPSPGCTSLYSPTEYRQETSFLIIGERLNASGSRTFNRLLEAEDWDGIVNLAREQVRHDGAHVLDVNVDYAGRDNARDMQEVVRRLVRQVNAPLMLDSTQVGTIEAGLRCAGGKCIINSANFEEGEHKFDELCRLARMYGAALVIGSIDEDREQSMARTAERKLAIALRGFRRATEVHGLSPADLFLDPLVLPVSTGMESDRRSALETIEGVRRISHELPECQTTVGLSNVSFGLTPAARVVLNSVFLHELREAGLTSAILHFSRILPRNRIPDAQWEAALDVIHDRRITGGRGVPTASPDPLQRFIDLFKEAPGAPAPKREDRVMTLEERLRAHIVNGSKDGLTRTLDEALTRYSALDIINDHLLDGMKTVGDLFGSGRMQLPFVLQSAEVMKAAVAYLEPHMERTRGAHKGTIVLATVKGDVHDIGKNLVDIILTNNGYRVVNLGIKQPLSEMVRAWREHKADAIGMSGLLVKSVAVMEENLKELNAMGLRPPVLLGGAALTRHYCEGHLCQVYEGECFYGKDAFEGLRAMDAIVAGRTDELKNRAAERQRRRAHAEAVIARSRADAGGTGENGDRSEERHARGGDGMRSDARIDVPIPTPPFWGTRVVEGIDIDDVYPFINTVALFRGQWQVKKGAMSDAEYAAWLEDRISPVFEALKRRCKQERILEPRVVYGYFPCNSEGNDVVIWEIGDGRPLRGRERMRLTFPRQVGGRHLCIADFFRPVESGEVDVIGMHCVTVGARAGEEARRLFEANRYQEYLYLHGLGVETAEALAEFWHKRMRQELGIAGEDSPDIRALFTQHYRGSRYSFGYPACPDLADQEKLFVLLRPERIGCRLTENHQIDPEQSTSAIVVHHPEARYFNV